MLLVKLLVNSILSTFGGVKVTHGFLTVPLTPALFKGQLYFITNILMI